MPLPMTESEISSAAQAAVVADLPRIIRSDATRCSEMIAKYLSIPGATEVVLAFVVAREALISLGSDQGGIPLAGDASLLSGEGQDNVNDQGPGPAPWSASGVQINVPPPATSGPSLRVNAGGKDVLLTEVLSRTQMVTSSGRAKQAIRAGVVWVNGAQQRNDTVMLQRGTHEIRVGEDGETIAVEVA